MRTAWVLAAGLLIGCDPNDGAGRRVAGGGEGVGATDRGAALTSRAAAGSEQVTLGDRLSCREAGLFAQPASVQAAWLTHGAALACGVQAQGGPSAVCQGNGSLRLFGLPVLAVAVLGGGVERGLQVHFRGDAARVAAAAGRALGVPLRRRFGEPGYSYDGLGADALDYSVRPRDHGEAAFGCSLSTPADVAALPSLPRPDGWGVLSGSVDYATARAPATRVCAIEVDTGERDHCVLTTEGDPHYRLPVPPGRWSLLAWPQGRPDGAAAPARHSAASACIAERETGCDDHRLRIVEIGVDEHRGGLLINDRGAGAKTESLPPAEPQKP